ncbi:MAG: hypothetical protein EBS95_12470 [Chitinophagia bacterium]|nr:hypothetical protein [Chitinophagia bacterium]
MLNLTNGLVLGEGKINAVGNCTLGKLVGTAVDMIFLPGITWCCTMLVTVAAGSAAMAAAEIPDKVKAASLGANTVNTLFLSDTAAIMPAFVTAAFKMEKFGLVFSTSPIVLPAPVGIVSGVASGTFLLQEVANTAKTKVVGISPFNEINNFFMISFLKYSFFCFPDSRKYYNQMKHNTDHQ